MKWLLDLLKKHTNEEGVLDQEAFDEAVKKVLPTMYVPNDVYNNVAKEKKTLEKKVDEYEQANLTDEEQRQKVIDEANATKEMYLSMQSKLKAESIFVKNGILEDDYKDFIDGIVSSDEEKTVKLAESLAKTMTTKIEKAKAEEKEKEVKGIMKPDGGSGDEPKPEKSQAEQIAEQLANSITSSKESTQKGIEAYTGGK